MKSIILVLTLFISLTAHSQDTTGNLWVNREVYRKNLSDLSTLRTQVSELSQLKEDTARLHNLIKFKDQAYLALKKQSDDNRQDYMKLDTVRVRQARVIASQDQFLGVKDKQIEKLGKGRVSFGARVLEVTIGIVAGVVISKL